LDQDTSDCFKTVPVMGSAFGVYEACHHRSTAPPKSNAP
jgi:hypothetical protein